MKPISKFIVANGAGVSTLTASIDTRGFSYAQIVASATITNGLSTTAANTVLEESDDNSTFTTVTTGLSQVTTSAATSVSKVIWNVDLRSRKRYLKPTVGLAATAGINVTAVLSDAADQPSTAAEAGAINVAYL
jgi:hypothetical protein